MQPKLKIQATAKKTAGKKPQHEETGQSSVQVKRVSRAKAPGDSATSERSASAARRRQDLSKVVLSQRLGLRLKQLRIACELSQEQLGGDAEVDRTAIGAIETGNANPTIYTLSAICRALNVTLAEFFSPISLDMNIKPTWLDPQAVKRRANRATPVRKSAADARGLR